MCGIVGYSGTGNTVDPVIEGLARLEYRGYDSAGISIINNNEIQIYKKEGKLENLKNLIGDLNLRAATGIGHTRWATHGEVNDTNAHPHGNDEFAIVHNGIIENAQSLREDLRSKGFEFKSETDTETFLNQLTFEYQTEKDIPKAISRTFEKVEGNSAFVVIHKTSHKLFAIKRSAPLVCGVDAKSGDVYVSSDPYALVGFTTKIYFPGNEVLCIGDYQKTEENFEFLDLKGKKSNDFKIQKKEMDLNVASKGGYDHFMLKEIYEQPELVKKLHSIYTSGKSLENLNSIVAKKPPFVHVAACGTALHAGYVIKNFLERRNAIRVQTDFASEFRYREPALNENELGLFISQSGETADTLACQELCEEKKLETLSIVNVEGSTLYRNCTNNLLIHAGMEIGVASTKAFTQQVLVGYLLSQAYNKQVNSEETANEFDKLVEAIDKVLDRADEIKQIAKQIYNYNGFIFTGRGDQYPIALEGALKLKEIAYVHAEGYAAGELKHGPISLIDENMVNIAIVTPDLFDKTYSNAQEVKARRGVMVVVGEENNADLEEVSDYYFGLDFCGVKDTQPIITNIVLQLLSYHIAKLKGTDIDKPRNLAKSVTVE